MSAGAARVGVVLTGGHSRRMGADKAFVEVDGRPMVLSVADALRDGGCVSIECQGGDVAGLASLGLTAHGDDAAGEGPVPAIAQAIDRHDRAVVVIAATDLPDLDGATVDAVARAVDAGATAAVATADGPHLVVAIRGGRTAAEACRSTGGASFRGLLATLGATEVSVGADTVRNVNRPDDLADLG